MPTATLHERLQAAVAKLVDAHLTEADACTSAELLDQLRELAEAADCGSHPTERCEEEADLVLQRIEELLAKA